MEASILSALSGFNLKSTKAKIYRDKFGHVCSTNLGVVRLQKIPRSVKKDAINEILFQHSIKEHLHNNGFGVDRLLLSVHNTPYYGSGSGSGFGDDIFTASIVHNLPNVSFLDSDDFLDVVAHIGKMHHVLMSLQEDDYILANRHSHSHSHSHSQNNGNSSSQDQKAQSALSNLKHLRKKILNGGKFSDFDMLFIKGYEAFAPNIAEFADYVDEIEGFTSSNYHICHNLLKEENIFRDNAHIIVTNFSKAAFGYCHNDLAYLIKRMVKAKPMTMPPFKKVIATYIEACNDIEFDMAHFKRVLLYPDKLIKVVGDYYNKKRRFAPNAYITRMSECLRAGLILQNYTKGE